MIVFAPDYDTQTHSTCNLAHLLVSDNDIPLLGKNATRERLIKTLSENPRSENQSVLFAMSHGTPDSLRFREGESALSIDDAKLLVKSSTYAFACYTAVELGRVVSEKQGIWWGYSDKIVCYIDSIKSPDILDLFRQIFAFIKDSFGQVISKEKALVILEQIKTLCENAQVKIDLLFAQSGEEIQENVFGIQMTLTHLWDRLRVWLPNQQEPLKHPEAKSPSLSGFIP